MSEQSFLAAYAADPQADAERRLLPCCASRRWAAEVAARRPYADLATLRRVAGEVLRNLNWADVREAVDAHPRIGERMAGDGTEAAWSRDEQSAAARSPQPSADLVAGNVEYERTFGHVFLIRATGRSADEILAALHARLRNSEIVEQSIVRRELAAIVDLRLGKLAAAHAGDGAAAAAPPAPADQAAADRAAAREVAP